MMPGGREDTGAGLEDSLGDLGGLPIVIDGMSSASGLKDTAGGIRRLAARGTALLGLRTAVVMTIGLGGNAVLARLLVPRDFGIVALAAGITLLAGVLADAGMAAGLVGRPQAPERRDLEKMLGLQLTVAVVIAVIMAATGLAVGDTAGKVTALVALTLPLSAYRSPAAVVLERRLAYRPLAIVEVFEALAYLICAVGLVSIGAGVWGLAAALVARSVVGSLSMGLAARTGWLRPRLGWGSLRSLLAFGVRFQAIGLASALQSQGINVGTASIAGLGTLGTWSLVMKIMQVPIVVFSTLWRVAYPATARLVEAGADPAPVLERGMKVIGIASGLLIAGLVGMAPALIPVVFGPTWHGAIVVLPWVGLALVVNGPVSVVSIGYLCGRGDASTVLRATVTSGLVWITLALPLLPVVGTTALGIGMVGGALAGSVVFGSGLRKWAPVRVPLCLLPEIGATVLASAAGWWLAVMLGPNPLTLPASGALITVFYLSAIMVSDGSAVADLCRLGREALRPGSRAKALG